MNPDASRELTLTFFPDGDEWAVRLDEFNLNGAGTTRDDAVRGLAGSFKAYMDRGVLGETSPVAKSQLLMERGTPSKTSEKITLGELLAKACE